MRRLAWSRQSRRDLIDIASYYDQTDPALADEMLERIEAAPGPLLEFPYLGSPAADGTRKWRVPKTPFNLFYDVTEDAVEITTVRHVRSDYPR